MAAPAGRTWHREYIPRVDPDTGARYMQLTSAPMIHETLQPGPAMFTPDSRRVVYSRRQALDMPRELWIADLATLDLRRLTDEAIVKAQAVAPDGLALYYIVEEPMVSLVRLDLESFEREVWITTDLITETQDVGTIRHDGRAYVAGGTVGPGTWALVRFDLQARTAQTFHESDAVWSAQPQYSPAECGDVLFRENHGGLFDEYGRPLVLSSGYGADLHVIRDDGSDLRDVNVGRTDTEMLQGSHCWAGDSGRVAVPLLWRDTPDRAFAPDRIVTITPGGHNRDTIGHGPAFAHTAITADGQWWVAEESRSSDLFVGSVNTHRQSMLLHTRASYGSPTYTQPRPLLTPRGRDVVFGSDATGVPQLHLAHIDDEVLHRLMRQ